ncbi:MAG TPA: riboflavin synthase [Gaiellaceae bacterium]|nr:riboflavin synthase [Gaiellaceae bacterium]
MFTGIVRELGRVEAVEERDQSIRLVVRAPETAAASAVGDSIALAGVCLTAVQVADGTMAFDAVPETLRRSTLGALTAGKDVNVEPALRAGEQLGGHIVQGHVDGVGRIRAVGEEGIEVELPPEVMRYCVEKGSIAIEGVSLTIADLGETTISVALVPHTLEATTLGRVAAGDEVNLEVDVVAKYVERLAVR